MLKIISTMEKVEEITADTLIRPIDDVLTPEFHSKEFETVEHFILKINSCIQLENKLFAIDNVKGKRKVAKISVENNKLLLHSLRDTIKNQPATYFEFNDVRNSFRKAGFWSKELYAFFDFSLQNKNCRIYVRLLNDSPVSYLFVNLCTGKGGRYYMGSFWKMDRYNNILGSLMYKYIPWGSPSVEKEWGDSFKDYYENAEKINMNKYGLKVDINGSLIFFGEGLEKPSILGEVNLSDKGKFKQLIGENKGKIVNCGIALTIPNEV